MSGMTVANILANGKIIICMDLENTGGRMEGIMKACILMTRSMALEFTNGQMVDSTKVIGLKASSMAKVNTFKKMVHSK